MGVAFVSASRDGIALKRSKDSKQTSLTAESVILQHVHHTECMIFVVSDRERDLNYQITCQVCHKIE